MLSVVCKESTLFPNKTRFSNEFLNHDWQESFDCDSLLANQDLPPTLKCQINGGGHNKQGVGKIPKFNKRGSEFEKRL